MHSVKLTVFIEDSADIDMEVRVVVPDHETTGSSKPPDPKRRTLTLTCNSIEDEYALGGYAGI